VVKGHQGAPPPNLRNLRDELSAGGKTGQKPIQSPAQGRRRVGFGNANMKLGVQRHPKDLQDCHSKLARGGGLQPGKGKKEQQTGPGTQRKKKQKKK